jgi:hypothetical protein
MAACPGFEPITVSAETLDQRHRLESVVCGHLGFAHRQGNMLICAYPGGIPVVPPDHVARVASQER